MIPLSWGALGEGAPVYSSLSLFGVVAFFVGVVALGTIVFRRGNKQPLNWLDYLMMFIGLAGAITGIAIVFLRFD